MCPANLPVSLIWMARVAMLWKQVDQKAISTCPAVEMKEMRAAIVPPRVKNDRLWHRNKSLAMLANLTLHPLSHSQTKINVFSSPCLWESISIVE